MIKNKNTKSQNKVELILQALLSAESSLILARKLLRDLDAHSSSSPRKIPGVVGTFDGNFMVTENGKKYQVPANYASKTKLVYGDQLKMIEEDGRRKFKNIGRVPRVEVEGILAKKDGKFVVVTSDGSYAVLPAAVKHLGGNEGDQFQVLLPKDNIRTPFAAISSRLGSEEDIRGEEKKEVAKESKQKKKEDRGGNKDKKEQKEVKGEKRVGEEEKKAKQKPKPKSSPIKQAKTKKAGKKEVSIKESGRKEKEVKEVKKEISEKEKQEPILEEEDLR